MSAIVDTSLNATFSHVMFRDLTLSLHVIPSNSIQLHLDYDSKNRNHAYIVAWGDSQAFVTDLCWKKLAATLGLRIPDEYEGFFSSSP